MYPIRLTKKRALDLMAALHGDGDIKAPANGWTFSELLQLAAACHNKMQEWGRDDDLSYLVGEWSNFVGEIELGERSLYFDDIVIGYVEPGRNEVVRDDDDAENWKDRQASKYLETTDVTYPDGINLRDQSRQATRQQLHDRARQSLPRIRQCLADLLQTGECIESSDLDEQIETMRAIVASYESDLLEGGAA